MKIMRIGLIISGLVVFSNCSLQVKKAYKGKLDVQQQVSKTEFGNENVLAVLISTKKPELNRFVAPMKEALSAQLPLKTQFKTISFVDAPKAHSVVIELVDYTGDRMLKTGAEGLTLSVALKNKQSVVGKSEILAGYQDDKVSIGGDRTQYKVSGYTSDEKMTSDNTASFLTEFLLGAN